VVGPIGIVLPAPPKRLWLGFPFQGITLRREIGRIRHGEQTTIFVIGILMWFNCKPQRDRDIVGYVN
jgi:hypothetical protein